MRSMFADWPQDPEEEAACELRFDVEARGQRGGVEDESLHNFLSDLSALAFILHSDMIECFVLISMAFFETMY